MAENGPPTLWDKNTTTPRNLRPPNSALTGVLEPAGSATDAAAPKFDERLSVNAKEFVPKFAYSKPPAAASANAQSSVQDRLNKHKANAFANSQQPPSCYANPEHFADINRLKQLIYTLTKDPGQFDQLFEIFVDTLFPYFEDVEMLSNASEVIVEQAIDHPNFRYSAARLCCAVEEQCAQFRASLHLKCEKELQSNGNKQGLLLFVAELYTQLHHDNIYGTCLIKAFKMLLEEGGNDNVKCVCQALKLTGSSLEKYNKLALDEVFSRIQDLRSSVSGTALSLVDSVIGLRKVNWGQSSPNDTQSNHSDQDGFYWGEPTGGNTVYFHTDGVKMSSEESDFLAANLQANEEYLGESEFDPDELYDPEPEMDEEIQAGFKEFVKFSRR